ncbi:MAG: TolC family protein [Verrucomicrobiota bacterium]
MTKYILLLCGFAVAAGGVSDPALHVAAIQDRGTLTSEQALELARNNSPELRAARLDTQATEQAVAAAGRWKNPNLNFKAEGVGGDLDGFDGTEYEIVLKQTFERGGKRKHDRAVAERSIGVAFQAEAEKEMALLAEVRLAFIEVFAQQEIGNVRAEQEQLGRAFVEVAKRRHDTGGGSELEVLQAELAFEEILLSQTCCFGDLKAARVELASLIGIAEETLPELEGEYYDLQTMQDMEIGDHPALKQLNARIEVMQAQASRAKARDAADVTLGAGYKYEAAEDVNTFVLTASMPLNFVRAGKAGQSSVLTQVEALQAGREELRRKMQQELSMLTAIYGGAKMEAEMTRDKLMPKAEQAYGLSRAGYDAGRFSWFELINAQHHLADIRIRHIESLRDAHLARAQISKFMKKGI